MDEYLNLRLNHVITSATSSYACLQRIGWGGTAETYLVLAKAGSLRGQIFAMKIFRRLSKPDWRTNFLDEVKFLQSCDHPAVMRVFDEGLYLDEHPFVVAEYLPSTLGDAIRIRPKMTEKMAYTLQMLSGLEYLATEAVSVVHRDIKPANIFIKGGSCVIGDFGLIKRTKVDRDPRFDRELIKASFGPRMPRSYRTPDLIDYFKGGPAPTVKSDIYQLGLVLAEMFRDRGANIQKPMKADDFTEPIELWPYFVPGGLGKPIKDLIEWMLAEDAAKRPNAHEILPQWQDLFLVAAARSDALEGRVL